MAFLPDIAQFMMRLDPAMPFAPTCIKDLLCRVGYVEVPC